MLERLYRDGLCVGRGAHGALTARRATVRCALSSIVYVSRFLSWVVSGACETGAQSKRVCQCALRATVRSAHGSASEQCGGSARAQTTGTAGGAPLHQQQSHTLRYIRARTRALKKPRHRRHTHTRTHAHHTHSHSRRPVAATQPRFRERARMKPTPSGDAPLRPS